MLITQKIKKYKVEIIASILLAASYFLLRLVNIMTLPIFTDEAIYVRWSQIARFDANWRFISLTDGKQPSFVWIAMTIMKFVNDPLLAARLVSVFAGFATMIGLYFLGRELFKNRWVGIISSFLYLIFPMALLYDRMALYDTLVGTFAVWSLYFAVLLVKMVRLDVALILGMLMGGGVLTKTSAFFSIPLLFATYILFDWKKKLWRKNLAKLIGLSFISIVITLTMYSILRLSPFYHIINDKNSLFAFPFNEWLKHPFLYFFSNFRGLFDWLLAYVTPPLLLLITASFLITDTFNKKRLATLIKVFTPALLIILVLNFPASVTYIKKTFDLEIQTIIPYIFLTLFLIFSLISFIGKYKQWREKMLLFLWFIVPFVYLIFFGKTLYPRFIFFMTLSLLPMAAQSIFELSQKVKNKAIFAALLVLLLAMPLYIDYFIVANIEVAPIPKSDYEQYINNWPAGGGIKEVISYLDGESKKGKIYVASAGTFGSLPTYAVEIYLGDNRNVEKRGIYPVPKEIPKDLLEIAKIMPVYVFMSNQREFEQAVANWPMTLLAQYKKGTGEARTKLYLVNSK